MGSEITIFSFLITILFNLINGLLAIGLLILGYKLFDWLTPRWNFYEVYRNGRVTSGAIVIGAFLIGMSIIVSTAAY